MHAADDPNISATRTLGEFDRPSFVTRWDAESATEKAVAVGGKMTTYYMPFSKELVQRILAQQEEYLQLYGNTDAGSPTKFYIIDGAEKYGSFSADAIMNRHFDDLVAYGRNAKWPKILKPLNNGEQPLLQQQPQPAQQQPSTITTFTALGPDALAAIEKLEEQKKQVQ